MGYVVVNATFNNILVMSWRSVLLVEESGVPGENHWPVTSHSQTWSHNAVSSTCTCRFNILVCRDRMVHCSWIYNYNLHVPIQSVLITTKIVSSNPVHGEVYSIQHYVIKFVSDLWQVSGFLQVLRIPPPENHWPVTSHSQTWSHNAVSSTPRHERGSNSQF
jgi:hypothetical protein